MNIQGWHIAILIILAILLFGAPKLPGLARSVGQSLRIFKSEVRQMQDENKSTSADEPVEGRIVTNPKGSGAYPEPSPAPSPAPTQPGTPGNDQRAAGNPPTGL